MCPPAPWSGEVGEVAERNAISAKTGKAVHQREGGKRDTGERQRLREDRIEAKKEIRKTVS
jgi:hypothetical protein